MTDTAKRAICAVAAGLGLLLFGAQAARAEPMRCSNERNTCITVCKKYSNPAAAKKCTDACHISQSICMRTGCWDNGASRYCGLMRQ